MPSKNTVKIYAEDGYYHLYNRGVEKRNIFIDEEDCSVFLRYLKQYLCPKEELKTLSGTGLRVDRLIRSNMSDEIELLSFALMPNHFHLLVKQFTKNAISKFTMRLLTSYSMYFNKKYQRVGTLFQDTYKGSIILDDQYILHLSKYIHNNPHKLGRMNIDYKQFTSLPYNLGEKTASWIKPKFILEYFITHGGIYSSSHKEFVEDFQFNSQEILRDLTMEED